LTTIARPGARPDKYEARLTFHLFGDARFAHKVVAVVGFVGQFVALTFTNPCNQYTSKYESEKAFFKSWIFQWFTIKTMTFFQGFGIKCFFLFAQKYEASFFGQVRLKMMTFSVL